LEVERLRAFDLFLFAPYPPKGEKWRMDYGERKARLKVGGWETEDF